MPIYEFHCEECGRESEILVPRTRWEGTKCPHCGSTKLIKKISNIARINNGAGSPDSGSSSSSCSGKCSSSCSGCR